MKGDKCSRTLSPLPYAERSSIAFLLMPLLFLCLSSDHLPVIYSVKGIENQKSTYFSTQKKTYKNSYHI